MLGLKRSYDRFNFEGENGSSISKVSLELRQLILHTPNKRSLARAEDEKKLKKHFGNVSPNQDQTTRHLFMAST